jgi:hypothetical protein
VLGTDQGRLVPEATGGLQELALIAAGRLGQNPEALQAYFLGEALKAAQKLLDRAGLVGDLLFNLGGSTSSLRLVLGIKGQRGLRNVEATEQLLGSPRLAGGVDCLRRVVDLESHGAELVWECRKKRSSQCSEAPSSLHGSA